MLDGWSNAPRTVLAVALWVSWAVVLTASFAPRTWGLTAWRIASACFLVGTAVGVATADVGTTPAVVALATVTLVAALGTLPEVAELFANGNAYGDERRLPLRTPWGVALLVAPLSTLLVGAGVISGPLLLADRRWVIGIPVLVVGLPVAAWLFNSVHALSRRWLVLVPGGIVVHDPLTLTDPVLLPRNEIVAVTADPPPDPEALDLRMGRLDGTVAIELREPARLPVLGRNRREATMVSAETLLVSSAKLDASMQ